MNGGAVDVNVLNVYVDPTLAPLIYPTGLFNPAGTNWYWVQIDNNGTLSNGSWQNIAIQ